MVTIGPKSNKQRVDGIKKAFLTIEKNFFGKQKRSKRIDLIRFHVSLVYSRDFLNAILAFNERMEKFRDFTFNQGGQATVDVKGKMSRVKYTFNSKFSDNNFCFGYNDKYGFFKKLYYITPETTTKIYPETLTTIELLELEKNFLENGNYIDELIKTKPGPSNDINSIAYSLKVYNNVSIVSNMVYLHHDTYFYITEIDRPIVNESLILLVPFGMVTIKFVGRKEQISRYEPESGISDKELTLLIQASIDFIKQKNPKSKLNLNDVMSSFGMGKVIKFRPRINYLKKFIKPLTSLKTKNRRTKKNLTKYMVLFNAISANGISKLLKMYYDEMRRSKTTKFVTKGKVNVSNMITFGFKPTYEDTFPHIITFDFTTGSFGKFDIGNKDNFYSMVQAMENTFNNAIGGVYPMDEKERGALKKKLEFILNELGNFKMAFAFVDKYVKKAIFKIGVSKMKNENDFGFLGGSTLPQNTQLYTSGVFEIDFDEFLKNSYTSKSIVALFIHNEKFYGYEFLSYYAHLNEMKRFVRNAFRGKFILRDEETLNTFVKRFKYLEDDVNKLFGEMQKKKHLANLVLSKIKFGLNYIEIEDEFWENNPHDKFYYHLMEFLKNFYEKYGGFVKMDYRLQRTPLEIQPRELTTLEGLNLEIKQLITVREKLERVEKFLMDVFKSEMTLTALNEWNIYFIKLRIAEELANPEIEFESDIVMTQVYMKHQNDSFMHIFDQLDNNQKLEFQSRFNGALEMALGITRNAVDFDLSIVNKHISDLSKKRKEYILDVMPPM